MLKRKRPGESVDQENHPPFHRDPFPFYNSTILFFNSSSIPLSLHSPKNSPKTLFLPLPAPPPGLRPRRPAGKTPDPGIPMSEDIPRKSCRSRSLRQRAEEGPSTEREGPSTEPPARAAGGRGTSLRPGRGPGQAGGR